MIAPEMTAYRCSPEFSAAIAARRAEQETHTNEVWRPWNAAHRAQGVRAGFDRRLGVDLELVGFLQNDPRAKIPGLSMSLRRGYARPARGKVGDRWREEMAVLDTRPSLTEVFAVHGVPDFVMSGASLCSVGFEIAIEGTVYLACEVDLFGGAEDIPAALKRIPLSEFYAAREAREAAERATGGTA